MTITLTRPAARRSRPHENSSVLARYRTPTPPPTARGLTARQAGELARITDRHGASTWRRRPDGTVLIAVVGDDPMPGEEPTFLILRSDGTIARPGRPWPHS